uniref:Nudix hydrolase domain-containing protein n=1 Tax=Gadus morhua TaxID=8049 RepID=A0A8C5B9T1_GADMO
MLKGPQMGSCHMRGLLVGVRDSLYSASPMAPPGNMCSKWCASTGFKTLNSSQKKIAVTAGDVSFSKATSPSVSAPAPPSYGCGHYLLKAASHQNLKIRAALSVHPQPSPLAQHPIRPERGQGSMFNYPTQTSKRPGTNGDPANHMKPLPLQDRLQSISQSPSRGLHQACPRQAAALGHCLSPENEQRCRGSLGRNLKLYEAGRGLAQAHGKSQGRWASILVTLCSVQGEPAFLFTLRSSKLKRNKGDVSFAGGKNDPSDKDVVDTALREAREELGVTVATEKVWGLLKPLRETSGMMVAPVLANLGPIEDLSFKPNPEEVEEIFTLSFSHVVDPSNRRYTHFRSGDKYAYTLPVFNNGKHRVWGLTAVALDHALAIIASP